jgi:predicted amidohydrolase YtcJ
MGAPLALGSRAWGQEIPQQRRPADPGHEHPYRICIHCQFIRPDQLKQFTELKIIPAG